MVLEVVLVPVAHHFVALKILLHWTAQQQAALTATGMIMFVLPLQSLLVFKGYSTMRLGTQRLKS